MNARMVRAEALRRRLENALGPLHHDWLGRYRTWLDNNDITAETPEGWPTEEAYDEQNVVRFIKEREG